MNEKRWRSNILTKIIAGLFLAIIIGILLDIFLFSDPTQFTWKREFLFSNRLSILFAFLIAIGISVLLFFYKRGVKNKKINFNLMIVLLSIIILIIQIWVAYHIYFFTNWDVNVVTSLAAERFAFQQPYSEGSYYYAYFSSFPNNTNLAFILWLIRWVWTLFGQGRYFVWVAVSCILVNLAGIFTFFTAYALTKRYRFAFVSWILFTMLVSFSPWITIPYSDTYGILFPILALYLYVTKKPDHKNFLRWFLIGFSCLFGYTLKPTTLIVLIAILINEAIIYFRRKEKRKIKAILYPSLGLLLALFSVWVINWSAERLLFGELEDERRLTMVHYMKVGLNPDSQGTWNADDVIFSQSIPTLKERNAANIDVIRDRLKGFGLWGYARFMGKKALVNFADGSFAWSFEGNFYDQLVERGSTTSAFLREIFYDAGAYHIYYLTFVQVLWMSVLTLMAFAGLFAVHAERSANVVLLSVIGVFLFVMLFEARARYLFSFTPVYLVCAGMGVENAGRVIRWAMKKKRN